MAWLTLEGRLRYKNIIVRVECVESRLGLVSLKQIKKASQRAHVLPDSSTMKAVRGMQPAPFG